MKYSKFVEIWYPLGCSLDLVEGEPKSVAQTILKEVSRFNHGEKYEINEFKINILDDVFKKETEFGVSPFNFYVIPTKTKWSILWNNDLRCEGYDSLCSCLTKFFGFTTISWYSNEPFDKEHPANLFTYRMKKQEALEERVIYTIFDGKEWTFFQQGKMLPFEDNSWFKCRKKKDRFNQEKLFFILNKLNAQPWDYNFYDYSKVVYIVYPVKKPNFKIVDFDYVKKRVNRFW
jgi:hypothetical protein